GSMKFTVRDAVTCPHRRTVSTWVTLLGASLPLEQRREFTQTLMVATTAVESVTLASCAFASPKFTGDGQLYEAAAIVQFLQLARISRHKCSQALPQLSGAGRTEG